MKLNQLYIIISMGAILLFSTKLLADCSIALAVARLLQNDRQNICTGWPLFSNPRTTTEDDCIDCLSEIQRECGNLGTPLNDNRHTKLYNKCFKIE